MRIRFPIWLVCALIAVVAIPTEAFAQARTRPATPREREKARERHEDARERREDRRERHEDARERREDRHDRAVTRRREDIRERQWRDAMHRRERLAIERRAALRRDINAWRRLRVERAMARRRAIYARWAWAVQTPEGRAEFVLYSDRMARLHRIRDLAEERRDQAMIVRADRVITLENSRHANVIAVIISKR